MRKLYRSRHERIIAGVMGGIGDYFNIDPTLIRVIYTLVTIFTALIPGIVAYLILAFIIPEKPSGGWREETDEDEGPPFRPFD